MQALPPAAALLRAILDATDNAIVGTDLQSTVTSWNAAAERLFGYPAADIVGHPITILHPPDRAGDEAEILRRMCAGERVRDFNTIRQRRDGSSFWAEIAI